MARLARRTRPTRIPPGAEPSERPWASGINLLLGLWLVVAPWVVDVSSQDKAAWSQVVVGAAIALIAFVRISAPENSASLSLINVILGGWLMVAPFVLRSNGTMKADAILWNGILVGVTVVVLGLISSAGVRRGPTAPV